MLDENSKALGILCEEPMIQDYEGFPREFYSECMSTESWTLLTEFLALDAHDRQKFEACLQCYSAREALERYEEVMIWESFDELIDELPLWSEIPQNYHYLIDRERLEHEIRCEGSFIDLANGSVAQVF